MEKVIIKQQYYCKSKKQETTPVVHLSLLYLWIHEERVGGGWKERVVLASHLEVSLTFYCQFLVD